MITSLFITIHYFTWSDVLLSSILSCKAHTPIVNAPLNRMYGTDVFTIFVFLACFINNVSHKIISVNKREERLCIK